jgi:branched-chain amino acid transport system substrate-binding protein
MKNRITGVIIGCFLLAVGNQAFPQASPKAPKVSDDVVKIGVLTDMSGLYADLGGPGSVAAAQLAIDDFGGKVLGKPIQLVYADHQNKADVGASKAREWFDTQQVDMIVDVPNSGVALAVSKVANEKHKLFMIDNAGSTRLTNEDCNPYIIHYVYDTYATGGVTGRAVVQHGGNSWYFITADYAFGHSLQDDTTRAVKAAGGQVAGPVLRRQGHWFGQRRRRHHQLHQGRLRIWHQQEADHGRPAGLHHRHQFPDPASHARHVRGRRLLLGHE